MEARAGIPRPCVAPGAPSVAVAIQNSKTFIRAVTVVHRGIWRLSGGRIGGKLGKYDSLLLLTKGRKSGKTRVAPLIYFRDGDDILVVGSNGGNDQAPGWFYNILDSPKAVVDLGGERRKVIASVADQAEKARLWPNITAVYPNYNEYQKRTEREIPVVILRRRP